MDLDTISVEDFINGLRALGKDGSKTPPPEHWTFGNLKRGDDGSFKDQDLVLLMQEATDNVAGKAIFPDLD